MVNLTKKKDSGTAMMAGLTIMSIVVILFTVGWLMGGRREEAKAAPVAPRPAVAAPAAAIAAPSSGPVVSPPADETWTRLQWYEKFDPKKVDVLLTRVEDQHGCHWWMEIGAKVSGYKYRTLATYRHRSYRPDGYPDCPADAMPLPTTKFLTKAEMADVDLSKVTLVSRKTVKAGDPQLVAYYRVKRDRAQQEAY